MIKVILGLTIFFGLNDARAQTCEESFTQTVSTLAWMCSATTSQGCTYVPTFSTKNDGYGNPYLEFLCTRKCAGYDDWQYMTHVVSFCDIKQIPSALKSIVQNTKPIFQCGSIVQAENQVVGESVPITGASFSMNYFSNWVQGRKGDYNLIVPIAGATPRDDISSFDVLVTRNGSTVQSTSFTNNQSNVNFEYLWDGKISSTPTLGSVKFDITVTEHRTSLTLPVTSSIHLGSLKAKLLGLGGWLPSIYHFYDASSEMLYGGDGSIRYVKATSWNTTDYMIPEQNGSRVYYFDSTGRQVYTKTGLTGQTIETFNYDGSGRLTSIIEPFSRTTTFNRNLAGDFTSITSAKGHVTSITLDTNGYVATVTTQTAKLMK